MILCCLDQSTKVTGYSIWNNGVLIRSGVIDCSEYKEDGKERMRRMYDSIKSLVRHFKPEFVVIEETQYQSNQKVYRTLAQMQGLIFAIAFDLQIGVIVVEPLMWKSYIGIKSKKRSEQKLETIKMVSEIYKIKDVLEDECDSIAIGMWAVSNLQ